MPPADADPFAEFTEYDLKYLVAHLAENGRASDVHWLLTRDRDAPASSSAEGLRSHANGWFMAREQRGDTEGYLDDVARAWRLAEHESHFSIEAGQPAADLALEVRYALVTTSLGSLARRIPPALLRALVDAGTWRLPQALRYARQMPQAPLQAEALTLLARDQPERQRSDILQQALETTLTISLRPDWRVRALGQIAAQAPDTLAERVLAEGIETILAMGHLELDENTAALLTAVPANAWDTVAEAMVGLPFALSGPIRPGVDATGGRPQPWTFGTSSFARIVPTLPDLLVDRVAETAGACDEAVTRAILLASCLPRRPALLAEAAQALDDISQPELRAEAVAALAPHLSTHAQNSLVGDALQAASAISASPAATARALTALGPLLPEAQRTSVLEEALTAARAIDDAGPRSYALRLLAPVLPESLIPTAMADAQTLDDHDWGRAIAALAPRLPEPLLALALQAAREIHDQDSADSAQVAIAARLPEPARTNLLRHLLASSHIARDDWERAGWLARLGPLLPPALLVEALGVAGQIDSPEQRASVMVDLTEHVRDRTALVAAEVVDGGRWRAAALIAHVRNNDGERQELLTAALEAARDLDQPVERAQAITALAELAEEPLRQDLACEALAAASAIEPASEQRIRALVPIVPLLPEPVRHGAVEDALATIQAFMDWCREQARAVPATSPQNSFRANILYGYPPYDAYDRLEGLLPHVDEPLWPLVFAIVGSIPDELGRSLMLAAVAAYFPPDQLSRFREIEDSFNFAGQWGHARAAVLPRVNQEGRAKIIDTLLDAARTVPDERAEVLRTAAAELDGPSLHQAIELALEISDTWQRDWTLSRLVLQLPDQEAIAAAAAIETPTRRVEALSALAERLPGPLDPDVLERTLQDARASDRAGLTIVDLLPLLPEARRTPVLKEALELLRTMRPAERDTPLETIAPLLAGLPPSLLHEHWRETLPVLAMSTRADLLHDLKGLLPVLEALGGIDALVDVADTIEMVQRWWP
jgi:hypothetical protein